MKTNVVCLASIVLIEFDRANVSGSENDFSPAYVSEQSFALHLLEMRKSYDFPYFDNCSLHAWWKSQFRFGLTPIHRLLFRFHSHVFRHIQFDSFENEITVSYSKQLDLR